VVSNMRKRNSTSVALGAAVKALREKKVTSEVAEQSNDSVNQRRRYQRWTITEDNMVEKYYLEGHPIVDIAETLGRSVASIKARIYNLGLDDVDEEIEEVVTEDTNRLSRHNKGWSSREDQQLRELCSEGLTYEEISSLMGRTPLACQYRASVLGVATLRYTKFVHDGEAIEEVELPEPAPEPTPEPEQTVTQQQGYGQFILGAVTAIVAMVVTKLMGV